MDTSSTLFFQRWAVLLVYMAILALLIAGVVLISRVAMRMSKPGRIVVGGSRGVDNRRRDRRLP